MKISYLFERILGQEENLSMKELSINASDRPHVDGEIVMACAEKKLGCTVVLRDDLLGHFAVLVRFGDTCQTEVADLEQAVRVHQ